MKNVMAKVLTALALLAMLTAAGAAQNGAGSVTGSIRILYGAPSAGVRVAAITADVFEPAPLIYAVTQADADGRYRLDLNGVPPGRYYIVAGALDAPRY